MYTDFERGKSNKKRPFSGETKLLRYIHITKLTKKEVTTCNKLFLQYFRYNYKYILGSTFT